MSERTAESGAARRRARAAALLLVLVVAGCGVRRWTRSSEGPWSWAEGRADYLRRSHVWLGRDGEAWARHVPGMDLRAGPRERNGFSPEGLVRCSYVQPRAGHPLGRTPKFLCRRDGAGDDVLKVKWGADNGEVFAEVAAARLLWALGFPADRVYPVRVECHGCPEDPWRGGTYEPETTRTFAPATIERPYPGRTIEEYEDQGWTWAELDQVDPAQGGAPRAHTDALRLLAAFLQHRDSKPDNQRLVCPSDAVTKADAEGREGCRHPLALIQDLGSTFGGPAKVFTHKMTLDAWEGTPVWEDPRRCVASLTAELAATGGLERPAIGEEGHRLLVTLLDALSDRQLKALFEVARADRRGGVARWVAAFKQRREAVRRPVPSEPGFRCPD